MDAMIESGSDGAGGTGPGVTPAEAARRERLVREHLWLARQEARRYWRRGVPLEDLVAEGWLGLVRAAERWTPAPGGSPFGAYARLWVRGCIRAFVDRERGQSEELAVEALACERPSPEEVLGRAQREALTRRWLESEWEGLSARERLILRERLLCEGPPVPAEHLAGRMGITGERVRQLERALLARLRKRLARPGPAAPLAA